MNMLKTAAVAVTMSLTAVSAQATTVDFDVLSREHIVSAGGLATGITLGAGEAFSVTAGLRDYWSLGANSTRTINADGDSLATGAPVFGTYTTQGQSFVFGQLIGRIGSGDFFLLGTNFAGTAANAGELFLINWDSGNGSDNSGSITASVTLTPVPLPASGLALMGGLLGAGAMLRRKKTKS